MKHNKKRNTAFLYESLIKELTVAIVRKNNDRKNVILGMIKENFTKGSILRDELVTGPGGERGDKIAAMLSDGEFVTNSAAVRGIGLAAGADPNDEYEQRLLGAREMYKMQKFGEEIAQQLV